MSEPFLGEIRAFAGGIIPRGWALCDGALLPISENEALFTLIGTTYGGDGEVAFALPDLQGRVPVHAGFSGQSTYNVAGTGGAESVNLSNGQAPTHSHGLPATSGSASATSPAGRVPAAWPSKQYSDAAPNGLMGSAVQPTTGTGAAHDNMLPYQVVSFIIATTGIFPSHS
jgi:microcystin-dependent protein